jgi:prenyltransferase beta subunit
MSNTKKIMQRLKADPLPVILDRAPVNVKYLAMKEFRYKEHGAIDELKAKVAEDPGRQKILSTQDSEGHWSTKEHFSIEERQKAMQFLQQLKNLTKLYNYGDTLENEQVKRGLIALIKFQKVDGKFPLLLHHHGYALLLLSKFGLSANPLVEKSYRWISKRQRHDGGWLSSSQVPEGENHDDVKSCVWTTMVITQALANHSRLKNSEACKKGAQFILDNYLSVVPPTLFPEPNAWDFLLPNFNDMGMFRGGTLRFLEALEPLKFTHGHKNFTKAINWLLSVQFSDGLFPAVANISKQGDHMVSFKVLKLFKKLDSEITD